MGRTIGADVLKEELAQAVYLRLAKCGEFDPKTGFHCGATDSCPECDEITHLLSAGWTPPSIPTPDCPHCGGTGKQGGGE